MTVSLMNPENRCKLMIQHRISESFKLATESMRVTPDPLPSAILPHTHTNAPPILPGGFYTYEGSDPPDVSDGRPSENVFTNNVVSNTPTGVKLNEGDANEFIGKEKVLYILYMCSRLMSFPMLWCIQKRLCLCFVSATEGS